MVPTQGGALGLDPSKTGLGWSIIDPVTDAMIDYGVCPVALDSADEFSQLLDLARQVGEIVATYRPSRIFSERAWCGKNPQVMAFLERLIGAIANEVRHVSKGALSIRTYVVSAWHKVVQLKPDEYLTGKVTKKTNKPQKRLDFKAPAIRMVMTRWPKCQETTGKQLLEAAADATLVALAGVVEDRRTSASVVP